jgi:glycosyltransferase involved in cell wall biosynthesis
MRIIHVLHSHGYGGAENHVVILMRGQIAKGHEVMFVGPLDSWLGKACQEHGIPATHLRMSGLYDVLSHFKLWRLVRRWKADVVHGHMIRASYYTGHAAHRDRRPLAISTAHTTTAVKHMERCGHVIAVSAAIRKNLLAHGYREEHTSVIYGGVQDTPVQDRAALRRELGIADDVIAVAHAGRFVADKDQAAMVKAMGLIDHPKVQLFMIGANDGAYGDSVRHLPQDASRVHYLGFRSDVQRILQAFDVYIQPSLREGLPLAVSEAFVARLPVIASKVGGMPEVVLHEQTGLLIPPNDPPALAAAISRLAHDRSLAQRLALAGRQLYDEQLRAGTMVDKALATYERCLTKA